MINETIQNLTGIVLQLCMLGLALFALLGIVGLIGYVLSPAIIVLWGNTKEPDYHALLDAVVAAHDACDEVSHGKAIEAARAALSSRT